VVGSHHAVCLVHDRLSKDFGSYTPTATIVVVFRYQETDGHILPVVSESACLFSFIVAPTQSCDDVAAPGLREFSHNYTKCVALI
jgi:hypothetical protein